MLHMQYSQLKQKMPNWGVIAVLCAVFLSSNVLLGADNDDRENARKARRLHRTLNRSQSMAPAYGSKVSKEKDVLSGEEEASEIEATCNLSEEKQCRVASRILFLVGEKSYDLKHYEHKELQNKSEIEVVQELIFEDICDCLAEGNGKSVQSISKRIAEEVIAIAYQLPEKDLVSLEREIGETIVHELQDNDSKQDSNREGLSESQEARSEKNLMDIFSIWVKKNKWESLVSEKELEKIIRCSITRSFSADQITRSKTKAKDKRQVVSVTKYSFSPASQRSIQGKILEDLRPKMVSKITEALNKTELDLTELDNLIKAYYDSYSVLRKRDSQLKEELIRIARRNLLCIKHSEKYDQDGLSEETVSDSLLNTKDRFEVRRKEQEHYGIEKKRLGAEALQKEYEACFEKEKRVLKNEMEEFLRNPSKASALLDQWNRLVYVSVNFYLILSDSQVEDLSGKYKKDIGLLLIEILQESKQTPYVLSNLNEAMRCLQVQLEKAIQELKIPRKVRNLKYDTEFAVIDSQMRTRIEKAAHGPISQEEIEELLFNLYSDFKGSISDAVAQIKGLVGSVKEQAIKDYLNELEAVVREAGFEPDNRIREKTKQDLEAAIEGKVPYRIFPKEVIRALLQPSNMVYRASRGDAGLCEVGSSKFNGTFKDKWGLLSNAKQYAPEHIQHIQDVAQTVQGDTFYELNYDDSNTHYIQYQNQWYVLKQLQGNNWPNAIKYCGNYYDAYKIERTFVLSAVVVDEKGQEIEQITLTATAPMDKNTIYHIGQQKINIPEQDSLTSSEEKWIGDTVSQCKQDQINEERRSNRTGKSIRLYENRNIEHIAKYVYVTAA